MEMERYRLAFDMRNQLEEYILATQAQCEYIKQNQSNEQEKYEIKISELKGEVNSLKNTLKSKSGAIVALEKEQTHKIKAIHDLTQQLDYLREKYETNKSGSSSDHNNNVENKNDNNDSDDEQLDDDGNAPAVDGASPGKKGHHGRGFSIVLTSPNETLKTLVDHKANFTEEEKKWYEQKLQLTGKIKEQENTIEQLQKDIANLNSKNETMVTKLYTTERENTDLKAQVEKLTQIQQQQQQLIQAQQLVQQQQSNGQNVGQQQQQQQQAGIEQSGNNGQLSNIQESLRRLDQTMTSIRSDIDVKKKAKSKNDKVLDECEKDLANIKEQFTNEIERRLSETTNSKQKQLLDGYKAEIAQMTQEKEYLERSIESAETGLTDFTNLKQYLNEAQDKISVLEKENNLLKQDQRKFESLVNSKNSEIERLKDIIEKARPRAGSLIPSTIDAGNNGAIPENIETDVSGGGAGGAGERRSSSHKRVKSKTKSPFVVKNRGKSTSKHKQTDSVITVRMDDDSTTESDDESDSGSDGHEQLNMFGTSVGGAAGVNNLDEYITGLDKNRDLWKNEAEVIKYWQSMIDKHHTPV